MTQRLPPAKSRWGRCLAELCKFLRTLNIEGVPTANAVVQKMPSNLAELKPGVIVSPMPEIIEGRTNVGDWWRYRCQVVFLQVSNGAIDDFAAIDEFLYARERFVAEILPTSVPSFPALNDFVANVTLELGEVFDQSAFLANYDAQAVVFTFSSAVTRKLSSGR